MLQTLSNNQIIWTSTIVYRMAYRRKLVRNQIVFDYGYFPLSDIGSDIITCIPISIKGIPTKDTFKDFVGFNPVQSASFPTSWTELGSITCPNSFEQYTTLFTEAIQSVEELPIRHSIAFLPKHFVPTTHPSSSAIFEILDMDVTPILQSKTDYFVSYLPTSSFDKIFLVMPKFPKILPCFTASFVCIALEFSSSDADFVLHNTNIPSKIQLLYGLIFASDSDSSKSPTSYVNTKHVISYNWLFEGFGEYDLDFVRIEQENTIEFPSLFNIILESAESPVLCNRQDHSSLAIDSNLEQGIVSFAFDIGETSVIKPDRDMVDRIAYFLPVPSSYSGTDNELGWKKFVFSPIMLVGEVM